MIIMLETMFSTFCFAIIQGLSYIPFNQNMNLCHLSSIKECNLYILSMFFYFESIDKKFYLVLGTADKIYKSLKYLSPIVWPLPQILPRISATTSFIMPAIGIFGVDFVICGEFC